MLKSMMPFCRNIMKCTEMCVFTCYNNGEEKEI